MIVKNPKPFERYFLDYQSGQATLLPDVASSIVQGLLPSLGKVGEIHALDFNDGRNASVDQCAAPDITNATLPTVGNVAGVVSAFRKCVSQLATQSIPIYQKLEPFVAPDSLTPDGDTQAGRLSELKNVISGFLPSEFAVSAKISAISGNTALKNSVPDGPAILELSDLQKLVDAIANDLLGYSQRITDLDGFKNGSQDCKELIDVPKGGQNALCISLTTRPDDDRVYQNMVTRAITYSLNALNLVSFARETVPDPTKKRLLASLSLNFADTPTKLSKGFPSSTLRWEASAGAWFSSLPIRSFSVAPVFSKGVLMDNTVAQNILHPTVVPFAAANYRLSNDLGWTRWKSAIYWTGAVGVNPNTVSADFASGFSISWRALMFSPLWHFGHDVRLTQGFQAGQSLGADFKGSVPTETYWRNSFALGVSVRVPSLTGR